MGAVGGLGLVRGGSGWMGKSGRVGQGVMDGPEEASRRFEVLASAGNLGAGLEMRKLPLDEVGMRLLGRAEASESRRCLPAASNERLGLPGHVAIASASKEAVETLFQPETGRGSESETSVSLGREEKVRLSDGATLSLLRRRGLRAALLRLPNKLLYAEQNGQSHLLISSHRPSPDALWVTHRLHSL